MQRRESLTIFHASPSITTTFIEIYLYRCLQLSYIFKANSPPVIQNPTVEIVSRRLSKCLSNRPLQPTYIAERTGYHEPHQTPRDPDARTSISKYRPNNTIHAGCHAQTFPPPPCPFPWDANVNAKAVNTQPATQSYYGYKHPNRLIKEWQEKNVEREICQIPDPKQPKFWRFSFPGPISNPNACQSYMQFVVQ